VGADFVRQIYRDSIVVGDFRQLAQELMMILIGRLVHGGQSLVATGSWAQGAATHLKRHTHSIQG